MLIVADQADARKSLIALCESRGDIQIVGEAACGKAAIDAAGSLNPDIMILDATLPDMSGFDLLRAVAQDTCPMCVMVSSCAEHAARAFEEGAIDYLVMPVAAQRFDRAMTRARDRLHDAFPMNGRFETD